MHVAGGPPKPEPSTEVYPNAPLRAVAVEVYFSPLLDAHARFGAFQRSRAGEFDRLLYPSEREFDPGFDRPRAALLMGVDRKRAVAIAPDQLAAVTYEYSGGFRGFSAWALEMIREGLGVLGVSRLQRVAYRYENVIEVEPAAEKLPPDRKQNVDLSSLLRIDLPRPAEAAPELRNVHLYWRQVWPQGTVEVSIDSCFDTTSLGVANVNIAAECRGPADLGTLAEKTAVAHQMARQTFEAMITDAYRERLRGAP